MTQDLTQQPKDKDWVLCGFCKLLQRRKVYHSCFQDPVTGKIKQIMKTPYKKAHRLGGTLPVLSFILTSSEMS